MIKGNEHIEKMQEGRAQGIAVRNYLNALLGIQSVPIVRDNTAKIASLKAELDQTTNPLARLKIMQKQYNLVNGKAGPERKIDTEQATKEFIKIVKSYSERTGTVREVWLEMGVPAQVLDRGGVR